MESQPQNPEFRINPENFNPCIDSITTTILTNFHLTPAKNTIIIIVD